MSNCLEVARNLRLCAGAVEYEAEIDRLEECMREIQAATSDKTVLAITDMALCPPAQTRQDTRPYKERFPEQYCVNCNQWMCGGTACCDNPEAPADSRQDLPDLDPTGELKKQDDYYAELHGDSVGEGQAVLTKALQEISDKARKFVPGSGDENFHEGLRSQARIADAVLVGEVHKPFMTCWCDPTQLSDGSLTHYDKNGDPDDSVEQGRAQGGQ